MSYKNDYPILDGIAPSWADISVKVSGSDVPLIDMSDIAAINTGRSVEVGEQRSRAVVIKTTSGSASQEASFTLYRSGFQKLLRNLMTAALTKGYVRGNEVLISLVHFNVEIHHTPPGDTEIYLRRVKGARVIGDTMNSAEGTDAQQVEVPLHTKKVVDVIDGREVVLL